MTQTASPPPMVREPARLPASAAAREAFTRDGFISFDRLISDDLVQELATLYNGLLEGEFSGGQDDRELGGLIRQVMRPAAAHPRFADNPAISAALELATELAGIGNPVVHFDMLISKPPGNTNPTPWHQDFAYNEMPFTPAGRAMSIDSLTFWIPLDDADLGNGCMQFVPGAQLQPLLPHYVFSGDPEFEGRLLAATDEPDPASVVACPIPAGGCTVHTSGTLHYTGGNLTTDRGRRAYILNIGPRPD